MMTAHEIVNAVMDGISPKEWFKSRPKAMPELAKEAGFVRFGDIVYGGWKKVVHIGHDAHCVVSFQWWPNDHDTNIKVAVFHMGVIQYALSRKSLPGGSLFIFNMVKDLAKAANGLAHDYYDNVDGYIEALAQHWNHWNAP